MAGTDITGRQVTRTDATEVAYRRRLRQLTTRVALERGVDPATVSAADIYADLDVRAPTLSRATLRQYRAALTYGLETGTIVPGELSPSPTPTPVLRGMPRGCHTSSLKAKRLDDGDLRQVDAALRRSASMYAVELRAFLLANRIVGARVCEWRHAVFVTAHPDTHAPALVACNGKATNGRANGLDRTLHLGGLSSDACAVIATCAGWLAARHQNGTFDAWQAGAAKLLQRICRRLWPRHRHHVTLYTTRQHAAARSKAVFDKREVAALMGHASPTTAGSHYARTARGSRSPKPESLPAPDPAGVRHVRAIRDGHGWRAPHSGPSQR